MVVDPSLFPFLVFYITAPVDTLTVRVYLDQGREGGGGGGEDGFCLPQL